MEISFAGKGVLVTGAAAGIGKAIAEQFLQNGAAVFLVDFNPDLLQQTMTDWKRKFPSKVYGVTADLRQAPVAAATIVKQAAAAMGTLDVLVNNAGIYPSRFMLDLEESEWDAIFDLNVKGYFFMAQAVARYWVTFGKQGSIVNISSGAAANARPGAVTYAASKAAVVMLTKGLALEWIRKGIRVNAVGPGLIETEALLQSLNTPVAKAEHKEKISMIPAARTGRPSEIADAVLFLASDKARFIVGQNLFVDGGYTCGRVFCSKM
ncbi:MAG TPA: hypothetical protein DCY37_01085 [Acidaminococcaceae bacterium]|nr:hypothetical protein [Acidaminococcaceae bacterium]